MPLIGAAGWADESATAPDPLLESRPFSRFPAWMWANHSVLAFCRWLKSHNEEIASPDQQVGFYGLDIYSLYSSIEMVLNYLEKVDPDTAEVARVRYGCLMPWVSDPGIYGQVTFTRQYRECEQDVLAFRGPKAKAVVWEHNSHIGDARATEMSARGEFNIGQLARQKYPRSSYLVGFGTDRGTVAADHAPEVACGTAGAGHWGYLPA